MRKDKITAAREWRERFQNRAPKAAAAKVDFSVRALEGDTTEVLLYDEIGPWGVTAKDFKAALDGIKSANITLRVNSGGGDVFDAYAMHKALKDHPATVATIIDGLAASAASFVALAGDTVTMADPAMMMIHRAWTMALGNAEDMKATADLLAKVDGQIADIYAAKTGKSAPEMLALMSAETWLTAEEAGELGLADAIESDEGEGDTNARAAHDARTRAVAAMSRRAL